jgi:hypothetical protein
LPALDYGVPVSVCVSRRTNKHNEATESFYNDSSLFLFRNIFVGADLIFTVISMRIGTKLLLNVLLKSYVTVVKQGPNMFRLTCVAVPEDGKGEPVPCVYMFKTKQVAVSVNRCGL